MLGHVRRVVDDDSVRIRVTERSEPPAVSDTQAPGFERIAVENVAETVAFYRALIERATSGD